MMVRNKFSGEDFLEVRETGVREARDLMKKSVAASLEMASCPKYRIHDALLEISGELMKRSTELSRLIAMESGKPVRYTRDEVKHASVNFGIAAEEVSRPKGEALTLDAHADGENRIAFFTRFPLGVVYAITPFIDPLGISSDFVAPALGSRNSVIVKPSSASPASAGKLHEIIQESGLPDNSMALSVSRGGSPASNFFLQSGDTGLVSFTGRRQTAARISGRTALRRHITTFGGNSPAIVWEDADLDAAVSLIADSAFRNPGQDCMRVQRILVKRQSYEYFRNRLVELASRKRVGDPLDEATEIGPLKNEENAIEIEQGINDAMGSGADLVLGGTRNGSLFNPTILENVPVNARLWRDEVIGPVVCLAPVDSFDEAMEMANNGEYSLQAGIFTSDMNLTMTAIERLNYGTVLVNDTSNEAVASLHSGSMKKYGSGKKGIRHLMEEMSDVKLAVIKR